MNVIIIPILLRLTTSFFLLIFILSMIKKTTLYLFYILRLTNPLIGG